MKIRPVSPNDLQSDIRRFYEIMLHAYKVTEVEIWGTNYMRMDFEEFEEVIAKGELIGVWVDGIPVGSIRAYPLKPKTFAFGLFSVDFDYKGQNIGRKLILAAEDKARKNDASFMELEILRLRDRVLPSKQKLHDWYLRLGYEHISTVDFIERKPDKAEKVRDFVAPSVFDYYRKEL